MNNKYKSLFFLDINFLMDSRCTPHKTNFGISDSQNKWIRLTNEVKDLTSVPRHILHFSGQANGISCNPVACKLLKLYNLTFKEMLFHNSKRLEATLKKNAANRFKEKFLTGTARMFKIFIVSTVVRAWDKTPRDSS